MGECVSVVLRSRRGRPRFRWGRLGVDSEDGEVGEAGDSRLTMRGERDGEMVCCGASPQSDGVREEICVFGENGPGSLKDSRDDGFSEKPAGYCSSCPKGAGINVGRNAGLELAAEIPVAGRVGLKAVCDLEGKDWLISTDVSGRSKNESASRKLLME